MPKFRTAYDEPALMPSECGKPIYTWEYVTPDGEIVEESRDVYQMIQSCKPLTNYKELIEQYGLDSDMVQQNNRGIYADVTGFGNTIDTFNDRVAALIQELQSTIEQAKSGAQAGAADQAGAQGAGAVAQASGETAEQKGGEVK
jgi:crotonobetainyl-CoA:carnitine CoA-transferase CaiB-like acyl-CoA transferase